MPDLRTKVLELVNHANYQPIKPAVIAKKLGIAGEAVSGLKKTIKQLVKSGQLAWGPSHLVFAAGKKQIQRTEAGKSVDGAPFDSANGRRKKSKTKSRPSGDAKHVTGTFRRAAAGFGFVRPDGTLRAEGR